jgi:hypothetical protein
MISLNTDEVASDVDDIDSFFSEYEGGEEFEKEMVKAKSWLWDALYGER